MKPIKKITILGVGFMGGSLAAALKKAFPGIIIVGYARSNASYVKISKLRILDKVERDLVKAVQGSDLVVLASPVFAIIEQLKKISSHLKENTIVIDLGSSKDVIQKAAAKYLPKKIHFVGCHPLCGSDKSGAEFFNPNVYKGSICLVTALSKGDAAIAVKKIWQKLGVEVIFVNAKIHDKILSSVSHLTHLVSFSLTDFVPQEYFKFAVTSLKDLTRISNSAPEVWADIFISNKKNILKDNARFVKILENFGKLIKENKRKNIIKYIERINKKYKALAFLANKS